MGYNREQIGFVERSILDVLGAMDGRSMLELGNQTCPERTGIPERTGKEYFQNRGIKHVSIDLNCEDGALGYDLSRLIPTDQFPDRFDIITNSGTSEHVEPFRGQYVCFENIHNLLAPGGIAVHLVPDVHELELHGAWKGHCKNYYSEEFFRMLAEQNSYRVVSSTLIQGLRCVCLQKISDVPFMGDRRLFLSKIARRTGGVVYSGINDNLFMRPINTIARVIRPLRDGIGVAQIKNVYWTIAEIIEARRRLRPPLN
jgi:hypothetical protein